MERPFCLSRLMSRLSRLPVEFFAGEASEKMLDLMWFLMERGVVSGSLPANMSLEPPPGGFNTLHDDDDDVVNCNCDDVLFGWAQQKSVEKREKKEKMYGFNWKFLSDLSCVFNVFNLLFQLLNLLLLFYDAIRLTRIFTTVNDFFFPEKNNQPYFHSHRRFHFQGGEARNQ